MAGRGGSERRSDGWRGAGFDRKKRRFEVSETPSSSEYEHARLRYGPRCDERYGARLGVAAQAESEGQPAPVHPQSLPSFGRHGLGARRGSETVGTVSSLSPFERKCASLLGT